MPIRHSLSAPIVHSGCTVAADIIDHHTGNLFRATSVLMRRPVHAKTCSSRAAPSSYAGSFDSNATQQHGHYRKKSPESIHSWHSAFNAPSSSLNPDSPKKPNQLSAKPKISPLCGAECDLPERAYCVRKKICNTT